MVDKDLSRGDEQVTAARVQPFHNAGLRPCTDKTVPGDKVYQDMKETKDS